MQRVVIFCPWIHPVLLPQNSKVNFQDISRDGTSFNWTGPPDRVDICMYCGYTN